MKRIFLLVLFLIFVITDTFSSEKYVHFSVDDVIYLFKDITKNQDRYSSVFENQLLRYIKSLHDEFGVVCSLYCFYSSDDFNLSMSTSKFKEELAENSEWLKFGYHSSDASDQKADYSRYSEFVKEIQRIGGYRLLS